MPQFEDASRASTELFGVVPERSSFSALSFDAWRSFATTRGLNTKAAGAYLPRTLEAAVNAETPFANASALHELYGHGLLVEHTALGAQLQRGEPVPARLFDVYEGVAMLIEGTLAEHLLLGAEFAQKMANVPHESRMLYEQYAGIAERKTLHWTLYAAGFPKVYDAPLAKKLLLKNYPGDASQIEFAVVYGSRKPHADIDYFVVSKGPTTQVVDGVLDIGVMNTMEFEWRLANLDIAVTDPLFTGEFLIGDEARLEELKRRCKNTKVRPKHVAYALEQARDQEEKARDSTNGLNPKTATGYAQTYRASAFLRERGVNVVTRREIDEYLIR